MKSNYKNLFLILVAFVLFAIAGCEEQSSIGVEVLPAGDLVTIRNTIQETRSYTFSEDSIRTDEASYSLLGSFTDSLFGNTNINFAAQYRLFGFPDYRHNAKVDSVQLYLYYRLIYGDTITPQRFKVYELKSPLSRDEAYLQDVDLKSMAYDQVIGEYEYTPRVRQDSTTRDTFYQLIKIPIDISLGEKLISADSMDMVNNDVWLEYFKGLLVETEKVDNQGGTIMSLELLQRGNFDGSALALFYHNDSLKNSEGGDSALYTPFLISEFSARVNSIQHDYSQAPFYDNLNSEAVQDSLVYVQATGGLKSRILIDQLSSWKDSVNVGVNKAELIFQIDTAASQVSRFPPPTQMLFTIVDSTGIERLPVDYVFSPAFYGGGLNSDYTYRFTITQHLQRIIDGDAKNNGFFLVPAVKNSQANRAVIKGSTSADGVKLVITYSKYSTNE